MLFTKEQFQSYIEGNKTALQGFHNNNNYQQRVVFLLDSLKIPDSFNAFEQTYNSLKIMASSQIKQVTFEVFVQVSQVYTNQITDLLKNSLLLKTVLPILRINNDEPKLLQNLKSAEYHLTRFLEVLSSQYDEIKRLEYQARLINIVILIHKKENQYGQNTKRFLINDADKDFIESLESFIFNNFRDNSINSSSLIAKQIISPELLARRVKNIQNNLTARINKAHNEQNNHSASLIREYEHFIKQLQTIEEQFTELVMNEKRIMSSFIFISQKINSALEETHLFYLAINIRMQELLSNEGIDDTIKRSIARVAYEQTDKFEDLSADLKNIINNYPDNFKLKTQIGSTKKTCLQSLKKFADVLLEEQTDAIDITRVSIERILTKVAAAVSILTNAREGIKHQVQFLAQQGFKKNFRTSLQISDNSEDHGFNKELNKAKRFKIMVSVLTYLEQNQLGITLEQFDETKNRLDSLLALINKFDLSDEYLQEMFALFQEVSNNFITESDVKEQIIEEKEEKLDSTPILNQLPPLPSYLPPPIPVANPEPSIIVPPAPQLNLPLLNQEKVPVATSSANVSLLESIRANANSITANSRLTISNLDPADKQVRQKRLAETRANDNDLKSILGDKLAKMKQSLESSGDEKDWSSDEEVVVDYSTTEVNRVNISQQNLLFNVPLSQANEGDEDKTQSLKNK